MLDKETAQLPRSDAYPAGEILHAAFVQSALRNQPERSGHDCRRAQPCRRSRRGFRTASPTGPESCRLGCGRTDEPYQVIRFCERDGANRAAIDPRRGRADEKPSVEALIPAVKRLPPNRRLEFTALFRQ